MQIVRHASILFALLFGGACSQFENEEADDGAGTEDQSCEGEDCGDEPAAPAEADSGPEAICNAWMQIETLPAQGVEGWPEACIPDELGTTVVSTLVEALPGSDTGPFELVFENGVLKSIDGMPCVACNTRVPEFDESIGYKTCRQDYTCAPADAAVPSSPAAFGWSLQIKMDQEQSIAPRWNAFHYGGEHALGPADVVEPVCAPRCDGKNCGEDGCGGECGTCGDGLFCSFNGQCAEIPPPPPPPPPPVNRCAECLDKCSGSPFCGTNLGALCYDECYTPINIPLPNCDPMIQICV